MQPITISFTFATSALAAAFLASLSSTPAAGNAVSATPASTQPSAPAATATDAFASTPTPPAGGIDFTRDVVNSALKPLSTKAGYDFPGFLTKLGVSKVADLASKTDLHQKIIDHAKAQNAYVQAAA